MSEPEGGGIFLSYRRQESSYAAGRLYDRLAERFGTKRVFIDVDTIEPGVDFAEAIGRAVEACEVLLAIIGPQWLTAVDEQGQRRLDDSDDIVRIEIEAALTRNVRVIPILVENAVMPKRHDLPESLASLARRNAFTVRHESFRYDAQRLVTSIESVIRVGSREQPETPQPETTTRSSAALPGTTPAAAAPSEAAPPRPRSGSSVTKPKKWRLELVKKQGSKSTFRLSSGRQSHEIVVYFGWYEMIQVDGEVIAGGEEKLVTINNMEYPLRALAAKLGSDVTIKATRGHLISFRLKSLTLKIGDQSLEYESGIK